MKYSKRIEEYCDRLATAQEYETDRSIRPLVLSESLCCRVSDTFRYDDLDANNSIRGNAVVCAMVNGFMNELELIKMLSATGTLPRACTRPIDSFCQIRNRILTNNSKI